MSPDFLSHKVEVPLLKKQIHYVMNHSPFYRKKFRSFRREMIFPYFQELPFTDKHEILRDQELYPPFGSNLCADPESVLRIHKTSGTTNKPLIIALTRRDIEATVASGSRCFWASGLRPFHTVVHCLNYCLWMGGYTDHQSLEATGATVVPYGVGNSKALLETILNLKIDALHCTPSYLAILEAILRDEMKIKPSRLKLKLGLFGGEGGLENPGFRSKIESVWGFRAMNANYGMADVLSMFGAECECQNGMHFMGQGNILAELIDPQTCKPLPVKEGVMGEMVLTNINRQAQPLIRFRTHDLIRIVDHRACACGRKSFKFYVIGRSDDMLVIKGINVFPSLIRQILSGCPGVLPNQFQVVLDTPPPFNGFKLRAECKRGLTGQAKDRLEHSIRAHFDAKLSLKPILELLPEGGLPRTHGKTQLIIRNYEKQP
jgi:phenylacetate-CoA ligase